MVGYFHLLKSAVTPVPAQYEELLEISDRYDPGSHYLDYIRRLPAPASPRAGATEQFTFEVYTPEAKTQDGRKPSSQSSASSSEAVAAIDVSPHSMKNIAAVCRNT